MNTQSWKILEFVSLLAAGLAFGTAMIVAIAQISEASVQPGGTRGSGRMEHVAQSSGS
jgi:hypothetical protein